jgi:hypothetical protein
MKMGMFDFFKKKIEPPQKKKPIAEATKKQTKSAKEIATEAGEPYVNILSMDIDPNDLQNGAFELDWNDIFIAKLVKAGYMMGPNDTDADIVDRWFTNVCRNVVLETYEQYEAMDPQRDRVVKTRNLGDGRSEVS